MDRSKIIMLTLAKKEEAKRLLISCGVDENIIAILEVYGNHLTFGTYFSDIELANFNSMIRDKTGKNIRLKANERMFHLRKRLAEIELEE